MLFFTWRRYAEYKQFNFISKRGRNSEFYQFTYLASSKTKKIGFGIANSYTKDKLRFHVSYVTMFIKPETKTATFQTHVKMFKQPGMITPSNSRSNLIKGQ